MQSERGNMEGFKIGSNNTLLSKEYIQNMQKYEKYAKYVKDAK